MEFYLHFNLDMGRSPGFGSNMSDFIRPIQTRSRCGSRPEVLNLARHIHSPDHSTKGTRSPFDGLSVLVSTRFQVLFHSPPGVLFTFPSQYYALSVTESYLALGGGPPCFPQGFPCPVVLWILPGCFRLRIRGSHPLWPAVPMPFSCPLQIPSAVRTPRCTHHGLGSSAFARRY